MNLFSQQCEYAIQASRFLMSQPEGQYTPVWRILSEEELLKTKRIKEGVVENALKALVKNSLLESKTGPGGGFRLAIPGNKITLFQIKSAVEGVSDLERCVVGFAKCSDEQSCELHDQFKSIRDKIRIFLQATTLADMGKAIEDKILFVE